MIDGCRVWDGISVVMTVACTAAASAATTERTSTPASRAIAHPNLEAMCSQPSESSLFVAPHVIILKTCGTTLNLLGLHRILEIANQYCGLSTVWR